jgi:hypothetical protein
MHHFRIPRSEPHSMMRSGTTLVILGIAVTMTLPVFWSYLVYSNSALSEGRIMLGEKMSVAKQTILRHEDLIIQASSLVELNPRVLGAAICTERYFNYLPWLEPVLDITIGKTVGFGQVHIRSAKDAIRILLRPSHDDSMKYSLQTEHNYRQMRTVFEPYDNLSDWKMKLELTLDDQFNLRCAALILKQKLNRYRNALRGFDISNTPEIAATLYHIEFPTTIRGEADYFGMRAKDFYLDDTFMPATAHLLKSKKSKCGPP